MPVLLQRGHKVSDGISARRQALVIRPINEHCTADHQIPRNKPHRHARSEPLSRLSPMPGYLKTIISPRRISRWGRNGRSQDFVGFGMELKIQMRPLEVSEAVCGSGSTLRDGLFHYRLRVESWHSAWLSESSRVACPHDQSRRVSGSGSSV